MESNFMKVWVAKDAIGLNKNKNNDKNKNKNKENALKDKDQEFKGKGKDELLGTYEGGWSSERYSIPSSESIVPGHIRIQESFKQYVQHIYKLQKLGTLPELIDTKQSFKYLHTSMQERGEIGKDASWQEKLLVSTPTTKVYFMFKRSGLEDKEDVSHDTEPEHTKKKQKLTTKVDKSIKIAVSLRDLIIADFQSAINLVLGLE